MSQLIGLTAGEAFVVIYIAGFIITAQYWPKVGEWLYLRVSGGRHSESREK
ncbi:MAG: hypothetical protein QM784_24775 [Polyangiaceae bacterium]